MIREEENCMRTNYDGRGQQTPQSRTIEAMGRHDTMRHEASPI